MTNLENLKQRVAAGQPLYHLGDLVGPAFERHVAEVRQLQRELGLAIRVVYGPDDSGTGTDEQ